jgi:hypothetical protein
MKGVEFEVFSYSVNLGLCLPLIMPLKKFDNKQAVEK